MFAHRYSVIDLLRKEIGIVVEVKLNNMIVTFRQPAVPQKPCG